MTTWSSARPRVGDRCKFTKRYEELLRAKFGELVGRHGIVRVIPKDSGDALVRLDGFPGVLQQYRMTCLVREDHEGPDPLDETVEHTEVVRVWSSIEDYLAERG